MRFCAAILACEELQKLNSFVIYRPPLFFLSKARSKKRKSENKSQNKEITVGKIRLFSNFLWIFLESWIFWCFGFFGLFGFLRFRGFYSFSWILRFFGITEVFRLNSWIFNFWIQKIYFWSIWERVGFLRFVDFHFLDLKFFEFASLVTIPKMRP